MAQVGHPRAGDRCIGGHHHHGRQPITKLRPGWQGRIRGAGQTTRIHPQDEQCIPRFPRHHRRPTHLVFQKQP